jgi:TolB protein
MSADGSEPQLLTPQGGEDGDNAAPSWSPDGRKIAFASNRDLDWEIFVMDANGSGVKQLTRNTAWDDHPVWSPDGRKIAFQSHRTGDFEIFVMNANGTGQKKLSKNAWSDQNPCWSADGRKIVFDSQHGGARGDPEGDREVFVMNADGTGVKQQLTRNSPADDRCPSWCPVR